jgi:hypothetical protein
MQFVRHGPDIPERLLQAHEDGRVVFFCGAGISYPARLPGFAGLVARRCMKRIGDHTQCSAAGGNQGRAVRYRHRVYWKRTSSVAARPRCASELARHFGTPDLSAPNATATHDALLTLEQSAVTATPA